MASRTAARSIFEDLIGLGLAPSVGAQPAFDLRQVHALSFPDPNSSKERLPIKIHLGADQVIGRCLCGWLMISDDKEKIRVSYTSAHRGQGTAEPPKLEE